MAKLTANPWMMPCSVCGKEMPKPQRYVIGVPPKCPNCWNKVKPQRALGVTYRTKPTMSEVREWNRLLDIFGYDREGKPNGKAHN